MDEAEERDSPKPSKQAELKQIKGFREAFTLEDVLASEEDLRSKLDPKPDWDLYKRLNEQCLDGDIAEVVARHLNIDKSRCEPEDGFWPWKRGTFNVGIPVLVKDWTRKRVLFRLPLPHKLGEDFNPGNCEEKLRTESATYLWIEKNCPTVPTPRLWGMGLSNGQSFSRWACLPFYRRLFAYCSYWFRTLCGLPAPSQLLPDNRRHTLNTDYMIIDYIEEEEGSMLSNSWDDDKDDMKKREQLYRDLARIKASLTRIPLPRIGAFRLDNAGIIRLDNRPITGPLMMMERTRIPTEMSRDQTYTDASLYMRDLLRVHNNRLLIQPNAVKSRSDGTFQMEVLHLMRKKLPDISTRDFRLEFTDMHESNIFVDSDWRVTSLIDLEWACSLPTAMHRPPWSVCELDMRHGGREDDNYDGFDHYMRYFEEEERRIQGHDGTELTLTRAMSEGKENGNIWFTTGLLSFGLVHTAVVELCPFSKGEWSKQDNLAGWSAHWEEVLAQKLRDKQAYDDGIRKIFEEHVETPEDSSDEGSGGD